MKKKNDEVQSRRDFFKKAIKSTLPILAIMALPSILTSCEPDDDGGGLVVVAQVAQDAKTVVPLVA